MGVQAGLKRRDKLGVLYLLESCKSLGLAGKEQDVARWDPQGFKAKQEQLELALHLWGSVLHQQSARVAVDLRGMAYQLCNAREYGSLPVELLPSSHLAF